MPEQGIDNGTYAHDLDEGHIAGEIGKSAIFGKWDEKYKKII
jgi:hypothetical protein